MCVYHGVCRSVSSVVYTPLFVSAMVWMWWWCKLQVTQSPARVYDSQVSEYTFKLVKRTHGKTRIWRGEFRSSRIALFDHNYRMSGHPRRKRWRVEKCSRSGTELQSKEKDSTAFQDAVDFQHVYESDWNVMVSKNALETNYRRNFNKKPEFPATSDVRIIATECKHELNNAHLLFIQQPQNRTVYSHLQKCVLVRLLLYNARRPGEIEQLLVREYESRPASWDTMGLDSLKNELSPLELHLLKSQDLVFIRGKRGNKVPVIIPADTREPVSTLVCARPAFNLSENDYLFV